MIIRISTLGGVAIAGAFMLTATGARAEQKRQLGCSQIVAMSRLAGGKYSADEMAQKLNTDVETVRDCLDKAPQQKGGSLLGTAGAKPQGAPAQAAPAQRAPAQGAPAQGAPAPK